MAGKVWQLVLKYWELALLVGTWLAIAFVALRHRRDWRRSRFVDRVNFSLNYLEPAGDEGRILRIRTLFEDSARNIWLNEYGVQVVVKAARRSTVEQPFLHYESETDQEIVSIAVLNALSEKFAESFLATAIGADVKTSEFLFGLTWERYGAIRLHKLRVMVVQPDVLESLYGANGTCDDVVFEKESHRFRLDTLRELYRLWKAGDAVIHTVQLGC